MAVGDGYNDILMMQAADISIEIVHKKNNKDYIILNSGDVQINDVN